MKKAAMILAALGLIVALSACEPAVTMTAAVTDQKPGCGAQTTIYGKIASSDATTTTVRLQLRSGGKWVDWTMPPTNPKQVPVQGDDSYSLTFQVPWWTQNTLAIRMVSQDNKNASNSAYITPTEYGGMCD